MDTNFLISATQWNNSVANKLLVKLIKKNYELFSTEDIINEFCEVLIRDFKYSSDDLEEILSIVFGFLHIIEHNIEIEEIKEDPDDNKILECAVCSFSDYILTYDKHLLDLREFLGIKIVTPEEALSLL